MLQVTKQENKTESGAKETGSKRLRGRINHKN